MRGAEGADPASVAFDAVAQGVDTQVDVVLVDTAGRLHTSVGLMDQLGKVKRVVEKKAQVDEVLLVLDATIGQNGLMQARTFRDVVDITGVVLTKLDGTAKGGIVFQVQEELGPVSSSAWAKARMIWLPSGRKLYRRPSRLTPARLTGNVQATFWERPASPCTVGSMRKRPLRLQRRH